MIRLQSLTFAYPRSTPLLQDFSWQIDRGETWAVLGASGCGKTTLLYLLAGLMRPNMGKMQIDGQPLSRPRPRTGLILQDYGLLPWATVSENAELGLKVRNFYGADGRRSRAPAGFHPEQCSGGEFAGYINCWLRVAGPGDC